MKAPEGQKSPQLGLVACLVVVFFVGVVSGCR